jgi:hypothetical protein
MATTTGLVQALSLFPGSAVCCFQIGPTSTNTSLLFVLRRSGDSAEVGNFKTAMVDALVAAQMTGREVSADHGNTSSEVTSLGIGP